MDMEKIGILGIISVLLALVVRELKPQFSTLISLTACVVLFFCAVTRLQAVASVFSELAQYVTIKETYLEILLKIAGISYIADFSASLCRDAGFSAIAGQIEIFGKISILTISMPVVAALLKTISSFLQ